MTSSREAQRRRTRRDLVEATQRLLGRGTSPTIDEVAAEADVSRRTVYGYFPTIDQLLLDATVGLLSSGEVDEALTDLPDDPADRVEILVRRIWASAGDTLPLGRQIIRLTVGAADDGSGPRRGYRRVQWIETAVEPLRSRLSAASYERLVSALSVLIGWEAMTVLEDVRGLEREAQLDAVVWAARSLVEAAARLA